MKNSDVERVRKRFRISILEIAASIGLLSFFLNLVLTSRFSSTKAFRKDYPIWMTWIFENYGTPFAVLVPMAISVLTAGVLLGIRSLLHKHLQYRLPFERSQKPESLMSEPRPIEDPRTAIDIATGACFISLILILAAAFLRSEDSPLREWFSQTRGFSDLIKLLVLFGWYGLFILILIAKDIRSQYKNRWKGLATFAMAISIVNAILLFFILRIILN